jgi:autotransporter-associated beta strand protein
MIRKFAITLEFLVLAVSPLYAIPLVDAGTHFLLPGTQTQIAILASGGDSVLGVNFYVQIGDGGVANSGHDTKPIITTLDIVNDPRMIFYDNNTGAMPFSSGPLMWGALTTTDPNKANTLPAAGTLALLTIDTARTTGGEAYALKLKGIDTYEYSQDPVDPSRAGLSTNFAELTTLVNDGQIVISSGTLLTPNAFEIQTIVSQLDVIGTLSKLGSGTVILSGGIHDTGNLSVKGGTLKYNFSAGQPVSIGIGATLTIAPGATVELAGEESGLSDIAHFMDVTNNSLMGLVVSGKNQAAGNISGNGNMTIMPGAEFIVDSIHQNTVTLGIGARVTIRPIAGGPAAGNLDGGIYQVPEPNTLILLVAGGVFILLITRMFCPKTVFSG